jgi:hypothetical protein
LLSKLNKQELKRWTKEYAYAENSPQKETEKDLGKKFQKNGFATKKDLIELLSWKFETMKGRKQLELARLEKNPDSIIREFTGKAFEAKEDLERIKYLKRLNGVGSAVCSVILTFYDPKEYGIFDIHAGEELLGKEVKNDQRNKTLVTFFGKLRELSRETGLDCREIEKGLFQKHYSESKKKKKV